MSNSQDVYTVAAEAWERAWADYRAAVTAGDEQRAAEAAQAIRDAAEVMARHG